MRRFRTIMPIIPIRIIAFSLALATVCAAAAQETQETQKNENRPPQISAETVQQRLQELEKSSDLEDSVKTKVKELYQQALKDFEDVKKWKQIGARFAAQEAGAGQTIEKAKKEWNAQAPPVSLKPSQDMATEEIKKQVDEAKAEVEAAQEAVTKAEAEPARRQARRVEIRPLIKSLEEQLEQNAQQRKTPPPADEPILLTRARQARLASKQLSLQAQKEALESELAAYTVEAPLLLVQGDLAVRRLEGVKQREQLWRQAFESRRNAEAAKTAQAAERQVEQVPPRAAPIALRNQQIAQAREAVVKRIAELTQQLNSAKEETEKVQQNFQKTKSKIEAVGMTEAMGALLRKQRAALPRLGGRRREIRQRQTEIRQVQQELFEMEDDRSRLRDFETVVEIEYRAARERSGEENASDALRNTVRRLLERRRQLFAASILEQNAYFDALLEVDEAQRQLIQVTADFARFIDERILWMRSSAPIGIDDLKDVPRAAAYLVTPSRWRGVRETLAADVRRNVLLYGAALLSFASLLCWQRRLRRLIVAAGDRAGHGGCQQIRPTVDSFFATLLIAATWTLPLGYLSWRFGASADALNDSPQAVSFVKAIAAGLAASAWFIFPLEFVRQACRNRGLTEAHFGWPHDVRRLFRRRVRWLTILGAPLVFVAVALHTQPNIRWDDSLGRFCLMGGVLLAAWFAHFALRPRGPFIRLFSVSAPGGWMHRLRYLWYGLGVASPVALALLAVWGYQYTAYELSARLLQTAWLILALTVCAGLLMRWVLVRRRRLTMEQLRQQREREQRDAQVRVDQAIGVHPDADATSNLTQITEQTQQLLKFAVFLTGVLGVWGIWIDVLPAFNLSSQITLWQVIDGAQTHDITLAHLMLAVVVMGAALLAAKNIPGVIELIVLNRLPLDSGARYAISAISRYAMIIIGMVAAFNILGVQWSKYQWLVAAATVGLGFGLQEIFANFISGLILLFERPIRVGDVVTIDGVTGVVSRIRMRAATVTNWDRQEFIVPNKEFVTGRLLNWTLTSPVNRIVINVGVAYGSDTNLARELLLQTARQHPLVLNDPPPLATFEEFGASTLNFVLRCCLPDMEHRLQVIHELHCAIDEAFRLANIEIAFPQQDIHVRSLVTNETRQAGQDSMVAWPANAFPTSEKQTVEFP